MTRLLPLHIRIRKDIEDQIKRGDMRPGDRIPYEHELMLSYGCARMTVNKALSALVASGLIERRKKAGSFVAVPEISAMVLDIPDLQAQTEARGETYAFTLIWCKSTEDVLELEGVHICAGRPLCLERRTIHLKSVPEALDIDFSQISPGSWLLGKVPWTQAENRISAIAADKDIADRLGLSKGAACLKVDRRTWQNSQAITSVSQVFDGAHYHLIAKF